MDGSLTRTVNSGAVVNLSAAGSTDPDGDSLTYRWWHYPEASSYKKTLEISNATSRDASFVAPNVASTQTIHIILEVTDTGTPPLTRYQRVIVTVNPGPNPPAKNPAPVIYDAPWAYYWHPQPRAPNLDISVRRDRLKIIRNKRAQSLNDGVFRDEFVTERGSNKSETLQTRRGWIKAGAAARSTLIDASGDLHDEKAARPGSPVLQGCSRTKDVRSTARRWPSATPLRFGGNHESRRDAVY